MRLSACVHVCDIVRSLFTIFFLVYLFVDNNPWFGCSVCFDFRRWQFKTLMMVP